MAAPTTTPVMKATVAADTKDDAASAAKLKSMKDHYEKVISEQRAAKVRLEARLRSSQNYGALKHYEGHNDLHYERNIHNELWGVPNAH